MKNYWWWVVVAFLAAAPPCSAQLIFIDARENIIRGQGHYEHFWAGGDYHAHWVPGPWTWEDGSTPSPPVPPQMNPCPPSVTIYLHGNGDHVATRTEAQNLEAGLRANGYTDPVMWFGWNPEDKITADFYTPVFKKFLLDLKDECPNTKIHVVAFGYGARLALGALKEGGCATSVQLLAPLVANECLDPGEEFEKAPGNTDSLKVWTNDEDDDLNSLFDPQLGDGGIEDPGKARANYDQCDAKFKVNADAAKGGLSRNPQRKTWDAEDDHRAYFWSPRMMRCIAMNLR